VKCLLLFLFQGILLALLVRIVVLVKLFHLFVQQALFGLLRVEFLFLIAVLARLGITAGFLAWGLFLLNFVVSDIIVLATSAFQILLSSYVKRVIVVQPVHRPP
jgi:hypothetical protein